jgi:hypothetical protein
VRAGAAVAGSAVAVVVAVAGRLTVVELVFALEPPVPRPPPAALRTCGLPPPLPLRGWVAPLPLWTFP